MSNIINLYNSFHLGDNVFTMILFYNIKDYIEKNDIIINYYCKNEYHKQINEFNVSKNVNILDYKEEGINVWIGNQDLNYNYFNNFVNSEIGFNDFYVNFFNNLLKKCNIDYNLTKLSYSDEDLLIRFNNLNKKHNNIFSNIDILVINSIPLSNQLIYIEEEWNNFCKVLNKKYNIITTKKIDNIKCTLDYNLTVKDIAALSINIKNIIAINTGVLPGLLNEYTLNNINILYYFDDNNTYSYPKFKKLNNLNELNFLIENETFKNVKYNNYNINYIIFLLLLIIMIYLIYKNSSTS